MLLLHEPLPQTLFGGAEPARSGVSWTRRDLDGCCYVDSARGYLHGAEALLADLLAALPLALHQRLMYGAFVDEPRLSCSAPLSHPVLSDMARDLSRRFGQRFVSCWVNYYRDGRDSVAWHGDRLSPEMPQPIVAIVSLGGTRRFGLRAKGGGPALPYTLHSGDALVMGGRCQQHFEHSVPKMSYAAPRMSVTFRT